MTGSDLPGRTRLLLDEAKYLSMSTMSDDGLPWTSVLQYVWLGEPLRFLYGSATQSVHSRHIVTEPRVTGALFVTGDGALTAVDGAQFTGSCRELPADEVARFHGEFYDGLLPGEELSEYRLPVSALLPPADHRIYQITVQRWWLIDTRTWVQDRIDRRIEMPLTELATAGRNNR